jgi:hypothetical protein
MFFYQSLVVDVIEPGLVCKVRRMGVQHGAVQRERGLVSISIAAKIVQEINTLINIWPVLLEWPASGILHVDPTVWLFQRLEDGFIDAGRS